ncbi:serine hydrolase [Pontixanthobacter aquaemixtae]|nr:serine hydrolase [Pontixanthobacter aquaemixtae]
MAIGLAAAQPVHAQTSEFEASFDATFGTQARAPDDFDAVYETGSERRIAMAADGDMGRIGVAAIDLSTGDRISVLGDQRFPMASTSKVAIAATFLAGVDQGRWSLTSEYPLLIPVRSAKYSTRVAPVRHGNYITAQNHLELMISKSCNACTDALLKVVGGPSAVNAFMRNAGIHDFQLTRDIATLVRDDGEFDPVVTIDTRDSASPNAMVKLLADIYQGRLLSPQSRAILMDAMRGTTTGKYRMRSSLPSSANLAHKTGTLTRTASDIGIFHTPDGRAIAIAIYVTGQSKNLADESANKRQSRRLRDDRISTIAREVYNAFSRRGQNWTNSQYGTGG